MSRWRIHDRRLTVRSAGLVVVGVLVPVLTKNVWLGAGMVAVGLAALLYAVRYSSGQDR
jgi:hypothetical protein